MERAPLKPPAGSTASTANESTLQKIRIDLFGESITEEACKKGMKQQTGDDPGEWEYIDTITQWASGESTHYYYKVPKMTAEDLKLRIAVRTCKATEEAAKHTRHIKYIIIALVILGIIGGMILNQSISNSSARKRALFFCSGTKKYQKRQPPRRAQKKARTP